MNELLLPLVDLSRAAASWVLATNLSTLALLAGAVVLDLLLARRLSPAWRIAFYLPVFFRVLVPPHVTWTVPFWKLAASAFASAVPGAAAVASCETAIPAAAAPGAPSFAGFLFVLLYALGFLALAAHWLIADRRLRRIVASCKPSALGAEILLSESAGPMVIGAGICGKVGGRAHRIIIPAWLLKSEALPLILAHERAHIARHDPALAFTLRLFCTIAWPIASLWLAASRIRALMEQACDEHALGNPNKRNPETVMKYANAMIDIAQNVTRHAGSLAFGSSLRSRIKALRSAPRWSAAFQVASALAMPAILLACSAARPAPAELSPGVLSAAPSPADQRTVFARVAIGHMPMPEWDSTTSNAVFIERGTLRDRTNWWETATIDAAPSLLVEVGQAAEVRSTGDAGSYTLNVTVHPSTAPAINATISFNQPTGYTLAPTRFEWIKGQTCIIQVPSSQFGQPPRTLIIDVLFPGEDPGC